VGSSPKQPRTKKIFEEFQTGLIKEFSTRKMSE
jgi:hypothetical protein